MPILGDRKRTDRDCGSFIQHNSESPTKSPASKISKSRKSLYENTSKNVKKADPREKDMDKILQELELIRQARKISRTAKLHRRRSEFESAGANWNVRAL